MIFFPSVRRATGDAIEPLDRQTAVRVWRTVCTRISPSRKMNVLGLVFAERAFDSSRARVVG